MFMSLPGRIEAASVICANLRNLRIFKFFPEWPLLSASHLSRRRPGAGRSEAALHDSACVLLYYG
jgi:hypothetical protein